MARNEIQELMFEDGSGFGDPDARRNAEQRLVSPTENGMAGRLLFHLPCRKGGENAEAKTSV